MHSLNNFLLDESILILFAHVFTWVKLIVTSLGKRNNQTSSKAAAWKYGHDTEVEQEGTASVHLFGAENSSITKFLSAAISVHLLHLSFSWLHVILNWLVGFRGGLAEHQRLLSLNWMSDHLLVVLGELESDRIWQLLNDLCLSSLGVGRNDLSKIVDSVLHHTLSLMKFIPELLLDSAHISPSIHLIGLNISNLILVLLLRILSTFDILFKICFLWSLDNNLSHFLRSLNFGDTNILLESLLDDLTNRQVVNFLRGLKFCLRNGGLFSLGLRLLLLLDLCPKLFLLVNLGLSLTLVLGLDVGLIVCILILGIVDNNLVRCFGLRFLSLGSLKQICFW